MPPKCLANEGQRVKLNALIKFGKWVNLMENCTDKNIRMVIFNNAKELVAGRMKELCDKHGIQIISSVLYSPPPNSIATNGTWAISHSSGLLCDPGQRRWMVTNKGRTPYELFYRIKPNVEHIHTFRCAVKVILSSQVLANLMTM